VRHTQKFVDRNGSRFIRWFGHSRDGAPFPSELPCHAPE
jgi:hypothetical protein